MELKFVFFILLLALTASSQSCLNDKGQAVDWWVILKANRVGKQIGGKDFGYYDSTMNTGKFLYNPANVDQGKTALVQTFEQINNDPNGLMEYVAWNDAIPEGSHGTGTAHSKSIIAFKTINKKGFLIDHSLPHYPRILKDLQIDYQIDYGRTQYAQHFFCISLTLSEIQKIAYRLQIIKAKVFGKHILDWAQQKYPNIYQFTENYRTVQEQETETFRTKAGFLLKSIYKSYNTKSPNSLIKHLIPPFLKTSPYLVNSWTNGFQNQRAICTPSLKIYPILGISLSPEKQWVTGQEHSKWILAGTQKKGHICFGDMNFQTTQHSKGGAFYCLVAEENPTLFQAFKAIIRQTDDNCTWVRKPKKDQGKLSARKSKHQEEVEVNEEKEQNEVEEVVEEEEAEEDEEAEQN